MKKILIIDDNHRKASKIRQIIERNFDGELLIETEEYAKGGLNKLVAEKFDFIVIDMFMPINEDGRIDPCGGKYVLDKLKYYLKRRNIRTVASEDAKIVVCSSEDMTEKLNSWGYNTNNFIHFGASSPEQWSNFLHDDKTSIFLRNKTK